MGTDLGVESGLRLMKRGLWDASGSLQAWRLWDFWARSSLKTPCQIAIWFEAPGGVRAESSAIIQNLGAPDPKVWLDGARSCLNGKSMARPVH